MNNNANYSNCKGAIDVFSDYRLQGWFFDVSNKKNIFYLIIDNFKLGPFYAENFRQDLYDYGFKKGFCGFKVVLPLFLLDNYLHNIYLLDGLDGNIIAEKKIILTTPPSINYLMSTEVYNNCYNEYNNQSVVIIAGFTNRLSITLNHKYLLNYFKKLNFYVIFSLATENLNFHVDNLKDYCDAVLIRKNLGYDFGSWAHAYVLFNKYVNMSPTVYFVNDSIIGPFNTNNIIDLDKIDYDICSITDSYQHVYHLQSYFWRVKSNIIKSGALDEFFYYTYPIPSSKEDAINFFELNLALHFIQKNFTVGAALENSILHNSSYEKFNQKAQIMLKKYFDLLPSEYKNNPIFEHIIMKIYAYYTHLLSFNNLNPSHYYWNSMIELGFPFIKKELITKNPTNYPFIDEISNLFSSPDLRPLLYDIIKYSPSNFAFLITEL